MTAALVLRSTRVLQPDGRLAPAEVHVDGAMIEAVRLLEGSSEAGEWVAGDEEGTELIDVGSKPITPAFVNAHTHVALGFLRGFDLSKGAANNVVEDVYFRVEQSLSASDVRAFARMGAYECLLNGVGLVWDHYYFADSIVQALIDVGLTGVVAPTLQDSAGPGVAQLEQQLEATERIAGDEGLREKGIFAALGPHATDTVSGDLWQRVAMVAEQLKLPVHSHAAQSAEECLRAHQRHGCSPLQWLQDLGVFERSPQTLLVHCLYAGVEDLAGLPPARTTLGFCPYAQRIFGFPADPRRWSAAGIPWIVATDTSAGNDSMNVQKELRAVAELRTSPTTYSAELQQLLDQESTNSGEAERALGRALAARQATFRQSADLAEPRALLSHVWEIPGALHPALRVGVIEPGALANLLVWDTDHPSFWPAEGDRAVLQALAMGDTTAAIDTAVICGRVVGQTGDFARTVLGSDAYGQAREEAGARLVALMGGSSLW